jgi:hypothetical protein
VEEDRVDGQYRCCWAGVGGKGGKGIRQVAPGGGGGGVGRGVAVRGLLHACQGPLSARCELHGATLLVLNPD